MKKKIYNYKFPSIKKILSNLFYIMIAFFLCSITVIISNNLYKLLFLI